MSEGGLSLFEQLLVQSGSIMCLVLFQQVEAWWDFESVKIVGQLKDVQDGYRIEEWGDAVEASDCRHLFSEIQ